MPQPPPPTNTRGANDDLELQPVHGSHDASSLRPNRLGLLPRNDATPIGLGLDEELIFDATQHHKKYTFVGTTLHGLRQYNDPSPYHLQEPKEQECLRWEIQRLVTDVRHVGSFPFDSNGDFSSDLDEAYQQITRLADQIKVAMGIIRLDNAAISLKFALVDEANSVHNYGHAIRRLRGRFDTDTEEGHVHDSAPKRVEPEELNARLYRKIVDYMTATLARTLMRTAVGHYWAHQMLSSLASCTVKLKILSSQPELFARQSISDASQAVDLIRTEQKQSKAATLAVTFRALNEEEKSSKVEPLNEETDASCRYHEEKTFYNQRIWLMLRRILRDLLLPEVKLAEPNCFQVYTSVYRAGVDGPPTIITCDRQGEISATSDRFDFNTLFTSLEHVWANVKHIYDTNRQPDARPMDATGTLVVCHWPNGFPTPSSSDRTFSISKADQVLSITVPLSLTSASAASYLGSLISFAASCTNEDDPVQQFEGPLKGFNASFDISTFAWHTKEKGLRSRGIKGAHDDVVTIASSPLKLGVQPNTNLQIIIDGFGSQKSTPNGSDDTLEKQRSADFKRHKGARDRIDRQRWVVSEDSIRISCRRYVSAICLGVGLLLCGSLAIPFTARDHITGVDPFNITLFSWLLSGLLLVIAKGRYVSEWPWHQFIHGHVVCRSIEELCEASNTSTQTVMSYLLLHEPKSILRTRGPYNGLFRRKANPGEAGFSINRPTHISTVMASGFVPLKILNIDGEHVIFLDIRKGRDSVSPMDVSDRIACVDLYQYDESKEDQEEATDRRRLRLESHKGVDQNVRKIETANLRVDRVLGVYVGDNLTFFG